MIGQKIHSLRKRKGLTLQDLGGLAGLSAAFLSQVEREKVSPSVSSLSSIARALDVNPSFFFPPPRADGLVVRSFERQPFTLDEADVVYARLGGAFAGRTLEPLFVTYPPLYRSEASNHAGEEFYFVLDGQLVIRLNCEEYRLNANDSMHFSSGDSHRIENHSDTPVQALVVTTPKLLE